MDFLLYWTTWQQIVFVLMAFSALSVLGLYLVRVLVPLERLKRNHEVAGFAFGVIGAFYGLLLAFVIVAAWDSRLKGARQATDPIRFRGVSVLPQSTRSAFSPWPRS